MPSCGNESPNWKKEIKREPMADEPSHARVRRYPADFEVNVNSRRPVMRGVRQDGKDLEVAHTWNAF